MVNRKATYCEESHCVFVQTNLDTRLAILVHNHETFSDFRDNFCKEHEQSFPLVGEINISALKVERGGYFYHLCELMNVNKAFEGTNDESWFLYADVERVDKGELVAIMAADQKEIADDSVHVDELTKGLALEEGLEESLDGETKSSINLNEPALLDESPELQLQVGMTDCLANDKLDENLSGTVVKDTESGEKNDISMGEDAHQTSDADMLLCQEKPELVDVQANQTVEDALDVQKSCGGVPCEKLDDPTGAIAQDVGKGEEAASEVKIDQEKELAPTLEIVDDVAESHKACEKLEKSVEDVGMDNTETDSLASYPANQLVEANTVSVSEKKKKRKKRSKDQSIAADDAAGSGEATPSTTTERKRRRKKSSKDHINQPATTTGSLETVNEIEKVSDHVDAEN